MAAGKTNVLAGSGIVDHAPFGGAINRTNANTGNWITVADISGKGFLSEALFYLFKNDFGYNVYASAGIRITIDGTIVYDGVTEGAPQNWGSVGYTLRLAGITQRSYMGLFADYTARSRYYFPFLNNIAQSEQLVTPLDYPYNGGSYGVCLASGGLAFNSNLKIEVKDDTTFQVRGQYSGGLL